jgi:hypothetical protein
LRSTGHHLVVLGRAQEGVAMLVDMASLHSGSSEFTATDERDAAKLRAVRCSCAT